MAAPADAIPARSSRRVAVSPVALALTALCLLTGGLGLYEATTDAPTIDEPVYVSAGLSSLTRHDLRLNPQHPPLAKALAAIPVLLFADPHQPRLVLAHPHERRYAAAFLQRARSAGGLRRITLLSRLVPLLELMASGLLVFALAGRIGGRRGGLFAAALWMLNPYVVGIGHLDGIDMPATVTTLLVMLSVVRWGEQRSTRRLVALGIACGAAVLARDTGPLVVLVALGLIAWQARRVRPVLVAGAVAGALVWATYLALDPVYTLAHVNLLPQRYFDGLRALAYAHATPAPGFLFGHLWNGGRWWFWPGSMLIKLPASMLLAFALVPVLWRRRTARAPLLATLAFCGLALTVFTVASPVDFGLRYLLPVIALACVATAALAPLRAWMLAALVAVGAAFTVISAPNSIAWTAPPFGPGYTLAAAGNLDWGQDAWRLQDWARGRHAWIGCYSPRGSGCIEDVPGARRLTSNADPSLIHGWVGISATLRNLHGWDPWLKRLHPVGVIGGTELLYYLR